MSRPASYANGFAPRDGMPLYPSLWRGCVGAWAPCLGPTGIVLRDWSNSQRHMTLSNMELGDDWSCSGGRYCLSFDGNNEIGTCANIWEFSGATKATVAAWVRPRTGNQPYSGFVGNSDNYSLQTGNVGTEFWALAGTNSTFGIGGALVMDSWQHLAFIYDGDKATNADRQRLFINGKQVAATYNGTIPSAWSSSTGVTTIGDRNVAIESTADIDDVRLYNICLTDNEMALLGSRRGIAYELSPRRLTKSASVNRRRRSLLRVT